MPLKYLFTATFADGSTIEQTAEDKSAIEPEKRSQFYDVMQRSEQTPLIAFVLKGEGHEYGVDLRDGHFEIDGTPFRFHEDLETHSFKIVFWRNHTHDFLVSRTEDKEIRHVVVYRIGWEAMNSLGRKVKEVMQID